MGGFVVTDGELRSNEVYHAQGQNARTGARIAEPMKQKNAIYHEDTKTRRNTRTGQECKKLEPAG